MQSATAPAPSNRKGWSSEARARRTMIAQGAPRGALPAIIVAERGGWEIALNRPEAVVLDVHAECVRQGLTRVLLTGQVVPRLIEFALRRLPAGDATRADMLAAVWPRRAAVTSGAIGHAFGRANDALRPLRSRNHRPLRRPDPPRRSREEPGMIDPCITNVRAYDYPSLALAGRAAAREAEERRQQAAEILDLVGDEHPGTRREASRVLAHAAAQHMDLRRLAHLADLLERHPSLVEAVAAVEAGGRVAVEQPVRPRGDREGRPVRTSLARLLTSGQRTGVGPAVTAGRPA